MSLLVQRHHLIEQYLTPSRIASKHTDYSSSTSFAFVLPSTPVQGNLMLMILGGIQSRTATLAGWTQVNLQTLNGANTHILLWKVAGASESNPTVTLNSALQGAIDYYELADVDTTQLPFYNADNSANQSGGSFTSATSNTFGVPRPSFVISATLWDDTKIMSVNNSFTSVTGTGRAFTAYRQYSIPAINQSVTWSKVSGTDATATKVNIIQVYGKGFN